MANILLNPNDWADDLSNNPPIWWNAENSRYEILINFGMPNTFFIGYIGSVVEGDVLAFAYNLEFGSSWIGGDVYINLIDNDSNVVESIEILEGSSAAGSVSVELTAGSGYFLLVSNSAAGEDTALIYELSGTITPTGDPEPQSATPPYIIRGTHRAFSGSDSLQRAWIRDEAGKHDLTAYEALTVEVKQGGRANPLLTLEAQGTDEGELTFTVTANGARTRLWPGTFELFAKGDGTVIYTGLLEVLG